MYLFRKVNYCAISMREKKKNSGCTHIERFNDVSIRFETLKVINLRRTIR